MARFGFVQWLGMKSTKDVIHNKWTMDAHRIYKFIVVLNVEFDEVSGKIIGRLPLPKIGEVFVEVWREESRRNIVLGKKTTNKSIETSLLNAFEFVINKASNYPTKAEEKPRV